MILGVREMNISFGVDRLGELNLCLLIDSLPAGRAEDLALRVVAALNAALIDGPMPTSEEIQAAIGPRRIVL